MSPAAVLGVLSDGIGAEVVGGALQGLVSSSLPHPQGEMSLPQPGWGSGGSHWALLGARHIPRLKTF